MRPAFILFAFAAFVAARPLEASTEVKAFNQLKHSGELDAIIEQAFQQWVAEQDDAEFLKSLGSALKSGLSKAASAGLSATKKIATAAAPHLKEIGSHVLTEAKGAIKDVASHGINAATAHVKSKIDAHLAGGDAPPAEEPAVEERSVDVLDEAVEQAVQEWLNRQTDASLMSLIKSDLNELD
ncbi:hypothetical protein ONZ45_g2428 [Pleurotus djamor]|nr:hypothetical protein ONZ45_g2428 [Pleurotus djamor]